MTRPTMVFGLVALSCAAWTSPAAASDIVTAEFLGPGNGLAGSAGVRNRFGQSFTATVDGIVSSIDLSIRRNGADPATVTVTLFETDGSGLPAGSPLGSAALPVTLTPDFEWYTVDFTGTDVSLVSGMLYAFMVNSVSGDGGYLLETARPGPYADGEGLVSIAESPIEPMADSFIYGDRDVLFSVKVVDGECVADINGDGVADGSDFFAWVNAFNTQAPQCDVNGDTECTSADFFAWVNAFGQGC
ncbi:MAG: GC-type dockerin domain-anchored protein [Planctomycetota bacterium]